MSDFCWETVKICFITGRASDLDSPVQVLWNFGRVSSANTDQEPNRFVFARETLSFRSAFLHQGV